MRAILAALLFLAACGAALAQQPVPADAPDIVVRESLDPASGAVIGQQVVLYVDVLFADEMPRPPQVSLPDVPGLQIMRFETQATTMRESIDGASYVGQRFEFAIYPRRGGSFHLPPATVTLRDREGSVAGHTRGQAVRLDITVPSGVDPSLPVIATSRLSLSEQWSASPGTGFKPGDALTRTITRSAVGVPGLAMLDIGAAAPEGVRIYADPPEMDDSVSRGVVTGRRIDRLTYVFERGGNYELPAIDQPWWNLDTRRLAHAVAAGANVTVSDAAVAGPPPQRENRLFGWRTLALGLAGFAMFGLVAALLAGWWRKRRADPERAAFQALRAACARGEAPSIYRCYEDWARASPRGRSREARLATSDLRAALFGGQGYWSPQDAATLLARLATLRGWQGEDLSAETRQQAALPPLNPTRRSHEQ